MYNVHHVLPISLEWPDIVENKIRLDEKQHLIIHKEQDISSRKIREYRELTNHILVPTNFVLEERLKLWKCYFAGAKNLEDHLYNLQLESLNKVKAWEEFRIKERSEKAPQIPEALEKIIEAQKKRVLIIIWNNPLFYK